MNGNKKIYISKEMLRDYASMSKSWNDITVRPYSHVSPDDIECYEYYRMELEDMEEVLSKCRELHLTAISFFLNWWEPLIVQLYDYLCLSDLFGPTPASIKNTRLTWLPVSDNDLLMWIIRKIYLMYEDFTLSDMQIDLNEYLQIDQILLQIKWHWEAAENEEVLPGRYIDAIKHDFIKELDNDMILRDLDPVTRAAFKTFTDELAEKGDFDALRIKGYACYGGSSVYECNWQTAADCMERLWKEGSFGYAANTLGYIYYYGRLSDGVPDYEKAFYYYSVASTFGVTESKYKLADMFLKGQFVKKNTMLAASMIEKLYGEYRYRFEQGEFDGEFADVALRMGNIQLEELNPISADLMKFRAYRFYLQAEFALTLRMQENSFFGDETVKKKLRTKMAELSPDIPHARKTYKDTAPTQLFEFIGSHAYCLYELKIKHLKNDRVKVTVTRSSRYDERDSGMTLVCYPYFDCCDLTDSISFIASSVMICEYPESSGGTLIFDTISTTENKNRPDSITFLCNGRSVAVIGAASYEIKRPRT